jgi:hypothetical protein
MGRQDRQDFNRKSNGKSHDYNDRNEYSDQNERDRQQTFAGAERQPLQWSLVHTIRKGEVVGEINTATGNRGDKMFSFSFGRSVSRDGDEKTTRFFRSSDLPNLENVVAEAKRWEAAEKAKQSQVQA